MASEVTTRADLALRTVIQRLRDDPAPSKYAADYRWGQIDLIAVYLEPTPELLAEAEAVVKEYAAKARAIEDQRVQDLLSKAMNTNNKEQA